MGITIGSISKRLGGALVLDDVSLDVPTGSLTALVGPSGSGKSTLLRVVAGLLDPDTGSVKVDGRDMTGVPVRERGLGFCFQHHAAFRHRTVRRNVAFGLEIQRRPKREIRARVNELLELVEIGHLADRYPSQLSGGQRQRMVLARALAVEPRALLLDEPFGSLDTPVRLRLRSWLRDLHERVPITTVLVTHDQSEAMEIADRLAIVNEGVLEQCGTPAHVYDHPTNDFVFQFLGPATRFDGSWVRPHDLAIRRSADRAGRPATVERVTNLGFEVQVEVQAGDDGPTTVQLTRHEADDLSLTPDDHVWVARAADAARRTPILAGPRVLTASAV